MTTKVNNLLTALVDWSMTALFETSQRENGSFSLSWRQYPLNSIKICNLSKDVAAEKKLATVGSGRLVFINKSHHLGVFDQCCQDL